MLTADILVAALDSAPDAIVITDASGRILFANARVGALLGYGREEILGMAIEQLLPQRFRTGHAAHRARYGERPSVRPMGTGLDLYALRKDATEVPVEISLSPIVGGHGRQLIAAALRDATERRRARVELIAAREAADQANQAKSRFLATASHDLRQPLQSLALLNGALRRMVADAEAAEALDQQAQAIGAMSRLLNALLDISKLESGAVRPEAADFEVAPLFEELRREFASVAASRGLELRVAPTDCRAHSDRALVGQILRNLMSNSVKYTQRGSVQLLCTAEQAGVQIAVEDTGIGIPAAELSRIYEEFYQVGVPSNASREGYGLGLSIVRRVVALLQLRLEARSEPGRGSIFTLHLPRGAVGTANQAGTAAVVRSRQPRDAAAPLILLVDDDAGVRRATALLLKVEGYRVLPAASLAEARACVRQNADIALLVTDYHLEAGETGPQVIEALRVALGRELPAVLISGDTSSTVRDLPAGNGIHLASKPIDAEQLLALLKSLIGS